MISNSEEYIGYLITDVARLMRTQFTQRAKKLGFARTEWLVLAWLRRNEGVSQAGLAKIMEISPMTMVRLIDKLEAAGFVERRDESKDRRNHHLYLSPHSHPQLDQLWAMAAEIRDEALFGMPKADLVQLAITLVNMRENMERSSFTVARNPANGNRDLASSRK